MSELDMERQAIDSLSAEDEIGYRLDCMVRELDELCLMAGNRETSDLIETNLAGVAQVYHRCKQIAVLIAARRRRMAA